MLSTLSTSDLLVQITATATPDRLIAELAARFTPVMTAYARRRGCTDAMTAVQAVHLAVWKAAAKFDPDRSATNADALVWNLFKNELRGVLRESTWRFGCEPAGEDLARTAVCDDCFDEFETIISFAQTLATFDEATRTVAMLVTGLDRGEVRTQRELADALGVSVGTANSRLRVLRDSLAVAA